MTQYDDLKQMTVASTLALAVREACLCVRELIQIFCFLTFSKQVKIRQNVDLNTVVSSLVFTVCEDCQSKTFFFF